jgi:hypothetical protein
MSVSWYLFCVDCAVALWLGKVLETQCDGDVPGWRFGIGSLSDDEHSLDIQKFLLLHRGHEVRTVSEIFYHVSKRMIIPRLCIVMLTWRKAV